MLLKHPASRLAALASVSLLALAGYAQTPAAPAPTVPAAPLAGTGRAAANRAAFEEQIKLHFAAWDADHDGTLSPAELNAVIGDPKVTGPEAAAAAALKQATRSKTYKMPPLTLASIMTEAETPPAKDRPNLGLSFSTDRMRIERADHDIFAMSASDGSGKAAVPALASIHQGRLGDCFCLAPLGAMVCRNPQDVVSMFQKQPSGTYQVSFGRKAVQITPPTDAEIAMTASTRQTGTWVNMYEKAVGTSRVETSGAGISAIDSIGKGGSAGAVLSLITGHKVTRFSCAFAHNEKTTADERTAKLAELRTRLATAFKDNRLVTAGTVKPTTAGLTPNHAYAVLSYDAQTDTMHLWNPHGQKFTPKGTPGHENGYATDGGLFDIPLTEFVDQFSGIAFETGDLVN